MFFSELKKEPRYKIRIKKTKNIECCLVETDIASSWYERQSREGKCIAMVAEEQEQFRSRVVILKVAKKAHNYDDGQARVWFFRDRTPLRLKSEVKEYQM